MRNTWKLSVWGVRGSIPRAGRDFMEYGGNTSCFSLSGSSTLVFDAGSGLACLGGHLDGVRRIDILISHVHLDHIMGLVGFPPLYSQGTEVHLYGEAGPDGSFRQRLTSLFRRPYWPLELMELPASVCFHELGPGDRFQLDDGLTVSTLRGNHPGGSLLYRVDGEGWSVAYGLDCELDEVLLPKLADFARGSSLLIWDANYAPGQKRPGWGHSTWEEGIALRRAAGAKRVLMTHYDRAYDDGFLRGQENLACQADSACQFAREGMVLTL